MTCNSFDNTIELLVNAYQYKQNGRWGITKFGGGGTYE
jgi:hypothetical protein